MNIGMLGTTPPLTPSERSARGDMYMFVRWMTVLVLAIGVVAGLSMPHVFVLGTTFGQHQWLFYFLVAFTILAAFTLSALASLLALILGWRALKFRAAYPLLAGFAIVVVWFLPSTDHPSDATSTAFH